MKKLVGILLIVIFALSVSSTGYASTNNAKISVIDAKYKNLWPLSAEQEDATVSKIPLFKFKEGKYYGVVNEKGNVIVKAVYYDIGYYQNGFLMISKNKKIGLVNNAGKIIIKPQFDNIKAFHDGLARVREGQKFGYINTSGKVLIPIKYDGAFNFINGIAPVKTGDKWGLIDKKGNYILEPKYAAIGYTYGDEHEYEASFADGISPVEDESGKWGYIDQTGKEIIPPQFDAARSSINGFATFTKEGKQGLATVKGIVLEPTYDYIGDFDNTGVASITQNNLMGMINKDMKVVIEPAPYNAMDLTPHEGYYVVMQDNKWGAIDINGNMAIKPQYDKMGDFYHGLAYVVINGKIGYINTRNELVIPVQFKNTEYGDPDFTYGSAIVNKSGKYGIINAKGSYLAKPTYTSITKDNTNKLYITQSGNKYGVLDAKGKVILKSVYSDIRINNHVICAYRGASAQLYSSTGMKLSQKSYQVLTVNYSSLSDTCMAYTYEANGKYGALIVRTK